MDLICAAFGYSFKESPVKQNQSPGGARRPAAKYVWRFACTHQKAPPISLCQRRIVKKFIKTFILAFKVIQGH